MLKLMMLVDVIECDGDPNEQYWSNASILKAYNSEHYAWIYW